VSYAPELGAIMVNDNGSYYKGYLGYPAVAFLLHNGELPYDHAIAERLKGVAWKDINQKYKNDFEKAIDEICAERFPEDRAVLEQEVDRIYSELSRKTFQLLGPKAKPPAGY
jgi:hypothetical protein